VFVKSIGQPLTLEGDWLIFGDVHAPTTDYDMAQLALMVAEQRGIDQLLVAGDLLNNDIFSTYPKQSMPIPWQREKAAARHLLQEWIAFFGRVVWIAGNHERRLSRALWGAFEMEDLRDVIVGHESPVEVSRFGYCMLETDNGPWRVTHPKNYSRIPLRTANRLEAIHQTHILTFHEHHFGVSWADSGQHLVANGGGLFEWRLLEYVMLDDGTAPVMVKGFTTMEGGYLNLFGEEPYTNWQEVLPETQAAVAARPALRLADRAA
jgi:3',5'-cyclic AMP phosphodiesterase CpdA